MSISTKGRYALRMMVDLAMYDNGGYIALRDVAQRQAISMKYMEQIVSLLTKGGFLRSVRGPQGGYKLTRKPEEYSVGDILRVTEGSLAPIACLELETNMCGRAPVCSTLLFWEEYYAHILSFVDKVMLSDLVGRERIKQGIEPTA